MINPSVLVFVYLVWVAEFQDMGPDSKMCKGEIFSEFRLIATTYCIPHKLRQLLKNGYICTSVH